MTTSNPSKFNILLPEINATDEAKDIIKKAKLDLLENLNIDENLVNRNIFADAIAKNRYENGVSGKNIGIPVGKIEIRKGNEIELDQAKYSKLIDEYKKLIETKPNGYEKRLIQLDSELGERLVLDTQRMIEFRNTDQFHAAKSAQTEAKLAYEGLNKLDEYKDKIELISKAEGDNKIFVVKRIDESAIMGPGSIFTPEDKDEDKDEGKEDEGKTEDEKGKDDEKKDKEDQIMISSEREEISTLSNVTDVNRAIAEREAGEMLRRRYSNTSRKKPWLWPDKLNLFMRRKFIKEKYVRKLIDKRKGMIWTDAETSATDRHEIEKETNMSEGIETILSDINDTNYPLARKAIDEIIAKYLGDINSKPPYEDSTRAINASQFQKEFTYIVSQKPISDLFKDNDIAQLGNNSLLKIDAFRSHQRLVWGIADHISKDPNETDDAFSTRCRPEIAKYISEQKKHPDFLKQLKINLDDKDSMNDLRNFQKNQMALTMISAQTLKLKIQVLNRGKEAYNVNEEKSTMTKVGDWLNKPVSDESSFGKRLKKHPAMNEAFGWIRGGTKLAALVTPGLLLAPFGPLAVASGIGGTSLIKTLFGKYSHYHKEHKDYQSRQAVNVLENRTKRMELVNKVSGMGWMKRNFLYYFGIGEKAKDVRQYRDYIKTTQDQLGSTKELNGKIKNMLNKETVLTAGEKNTLEEFVSNGLARLDFHKETGQNFLGSEKEDIAEQEYQELYKLVIAGSERLTKDFTQLKGNFYYKTTNDKINQGTGNHPQNQGYAKARKRFVSRQREKAILSSVKAGGIAFGLSYVASSLFQNDVTGDNGYTHENFALGKHDLSDSNAMYNESLTFFNDPSSANQTINFSYGGGTDATGVISGNLTQGDYLNKINEVTTNINSLSNITPQAKAELLKEINNQPWLGVEGMTNANLHNMRCLEGLEQTARALDASINASTIVIDPQYLPRVHDVAGNTVNALEERVVQGSLGLDPVVDTVPIPVPVVLNTFKEADSKKPSGNQNSQQTYSAGTL